MKNLNSDFSEKLQYWYSIHKRDLPWRNTKDPYLIWLSEIILQQTRVAQGLPYYTKFVEHYPTVESLANAQETDILRLWQGLGYYSRARNMHKTAQIVVENLAAKFPIKYATLIKLKGIGKYTASAIASFAANEHVAVLDGNVYRVLARFFGIEEDISDNKAQKIFAELAHTILPIKNVATHNQAIMEFGALQCTPKNPNCEICPFSNNCIAYQNKSQHLLPLNFKKIKIKKRFFYYLVMEMSGKFFMQKREARDIWQGLFDFLLTEKNEIASIDEILLETKVKDYGTISSISEVYSHSLTHQKLEIVFIHVLLENEKHNFYKNNKNNFYTKSEIDQLPKPIVIANYFSKELFEKCDQICLS